MNMSQYKPPFKTIYLNMEDDGYHAIPGKSESVYFCYSTIHPVLPVISKLSRAFINAHLSPGPYNISIFVPISSLAKFKPDDTESSFDRLVYLINEFVPPKNPTRITIYLYEQIINHNWDYANLWSLKRTYNPDLAERIMTFHYPENLMQCELEPEVTDCFAVAEKFAKDNGFEVYTIDYTMKYSDVFDLLLKTKVHVSYVGASYYLAGLVQTPTIGFGHKKYTQSIWGGHFLSDNNTIQMKNGILTNGRIDYSIDTITPSDVELLLEKYK